MLIVEGEGLGETEREKGSRKKDSRKLKQKRNHNLEDSIKANVTL